MHPLRLCASECGRFHCELPLPREDSSTSLESNTDRQPVLKLQKKLRCRRASGARLLMESSKGTPEKGALKPLVVDLAVFRERVSPEDSLV